MLYVVCNGRTPLLAEAQFFFLEKSVLRQKERLRAEAGAGADQIESESKRKR